LILDFPLGHWVLGIFKRGKGERERGKKIFKGLFK
jgi:hypothetical protein